jgi:hypothetical protein
MELLSIISLKSVSGGGGGGSDNYNDLSNKPKIEGVTLSGGKSLADFGLRALTLAEITAAFNNDGG